MAKREYTQLAHKYNPAKTNVDGWLSSIKLDGMRCLWDGGITRGIPKSEIPWANKLKDDRLKEEQISTGLWSRLGNVIHAPDYWLDSLPKIPLDGELYLGKNDRANLMSIVKKFEPGAGWRRVDFVLFDMIPLDIWLMNGDIRTTHGNVELRGCLQYLNHLGREAFYDYDPPAMQKYSEVYENLKDIVGKGQYHRVHYQHVLPKDAHEGLMEHLNQVSLRGEEGLMVRNPNAYWVPQRTHNLLKLKKRDDAEGTVIGYTSGRKTDKGSRHLGKMGALRLRLDNGFELEISGFTDQEREFQNTEANKWATEHPDQVCPDWLDHVQFPIGSTVTFKYRGVSEYGIPQEAQYWRKHIAD